MNRKIVCAAIKCNATGLIICGIRHYDKIMGEHIESLQFAWNNLNTGGELVDISTPFSEPSKTTQGFVDTFGDFHNRE